MPIYGNVFDFLLLGLFRSSPSSRGIQNSFCSEPNFAALVGPLKGIPTVYPTIIQISMPFSLVFWVATVFASLVLQQILR
ncbi:hypothetical protein PM082_011868 [Marasmius tenuissimus]|nr:hypothetical protein PM082_011868 [Marasmius tenuissimus]